MTTTPTVQQETFDSLKDQMGYRNIMQAPRVTKIIIGTGVGAVKDKKRLDMIVDRLAKITGQAPAQRGAKKSIANFKIRTGDIAGYQITLRGARAVSFLDKLIHVVFPRVKDFRGLKLSAIDEMGNISIGFREHTVFPETSDERCLWPLNNDRYDRKGQKRSRRFSPSRRFATPGELVFPGGHCPPSRYFVI